MSAKPTPTPWHRGTKRTYGIYAGEMPYAIATVPHDEGSRTPTDQTAAANARLIVDAVNEYARLKRIEEAARWYLRCADWIGEHRPVRGLAEATEELRSALGPDPE